MNEQIYSFVPNKEKYYPIQIYGYSSRSLPGIEINAPSSFSRSVKNKIIYFCRKQNIKIAPLRYVICYEEFYMGEKILQGQNKYLELPTLILFLQLAGVLSISNLNSCFGLGSFTIDGRFLLLGKLSPEIVTFANQHQLIYLSGSCFEEDFGLKKFLSLENLLSNQIHSFNQISL